MVEILDGLNEPVNKSIKLGRQWNTAAMALIVYRFAQSILMQN